MFINSCNPVRAGDPVKLPGNPPETPQPDVPPGILPIGSKPPEPIPEPPPEVLPDSL